MAILVWAICTAGLVQHLGLIYLLMQKVISYLLPAVGVCYAVGRVSRRVNGFGAVLTMGTGFVIGLIFLVFTTLPVLAPYCPDILLESNFYHVTCFLVLAYTGTLLVVSRFRPAPDPADLAFLTANRGGDGGAPGGAREGGGAGILPVLGDRVCLCVRGGLSGLLTGGKVAAIRLFASRR